jgi:hypothetical protein
MLAVCADHMVSYLPPHLSRDALLVLSTVRRSRRARPPRCTGESSNLRYLKVSYLKMLYATMW